MLPLTAHVGGQRHPTPHHQQRASSQLLAVTRCARIFYFKLACTTQRYRANVFCSTPALIRRCTACRYVQHDNPSSHHLHSLGNRTLELFTSAQLTCAWACGIRNCKHPVIILPLPQQPASHSPALLLPCVCHWWEIRPDSVVGDPLGSGAVLDHGAVEHVRYNGAPLQRLPVAKQAHFTFECV